ncbi:hypothetical protein ACE3MZ_04170 [Paenibacillus sp. WLX1005]|uniref:hypothetical protein n=1 Tax=Paenibacillus sp. WLX1005 TaxID=3243766 RepID=UPI0039842692
MLIIMWIVLVYILFTFVSTYIHELGHALSAYALGANQVVIAKSRRSYQVEFKTYFAFEQEMTEKQNIIVSVAGVGLQFIFSMILIWQPFSMMLSCIALIYMPYIFFNLLPFYGLDGHYVLENMATFKMRIWSILLYLSFCISWIAALSGLQSILALSHSYAQWTYLLLCLLIWGQVVLKFVRYSIKGRRLEHE